MFEATNRREFAAAMDAYDEDKLAGLYHSGESDFFADWHEFTESDAPIRIRRSARLILVARDFHGRTGSAFDFLIEHGLPVKLIRVAMYEDRDGRRFVDIEGEHDPDWQSDTDDGGTPPPEPTTIDGRRVDLADLVEADLVRPNQMLVWHRPRVGQTYTATLTESATIRLENGDEYSTPSAAAMRAAGLQAYDGWYAWRIDNEHGARLHDLRKELIRRSEASK